MFDQLYYKYVSKWLIYNVLKPRGIRGMCQLQICCKQVSF